MQRLMAITCGGVLSGWRIDQAFPHSLAPMAGKVGRPVLKPVSFLKVVTGQAPTADCGPRKD